MITVVKMVFSCLALRHKTGGSANNALPIKKSIITAVKPGGRSTRIKPVFVLKKWSMCRYFRQLTKFCLFFTQTNTFGLYMTHRDVYSAPHSGSVAERLKAPVLKTGDPKGFQSSNLCASARLNKGLPKGSPFVFLAYYLFFSTSVFFPSHERFRKDGGLLFCPAFYLAICDNYRFITESLVYQGSFICPIGRSVEQPERGRNEYATCTLQLLIVRVNSASWEWRLVGNRFQ